MPAEIMTDDRGFARIIGFRHSETCLCGCQHVQGVVGSVVHDSDTPKLMSLERPGYIVRFDVPSLPSGRTERREVFYYLGEVEGHVAIRVAS